MFVFAFHKCCLTSIMKYLMAGFSHCQQFVFHALMFPRVIFFQFFITCYYIACVCMSMLMLLCVIKLLFILLCAELHT